MVFRTAILCNNVQALQPNAANGKWPFLEAAVDSPLDTAMNTRIVHPFSVGGSQDPNSFLFRSYKSFAAPPPHTRKNATRTTMSHNRATVKEKHEKKETNSKEINSVLCSVDKPIILINFQNLFSSDLIDSCYLCRFFGRLFRFTFQTDKFCETVFIRSIWVGGCLCLW